MTDAELIEAVLDMDLTDQQRATFSDIQHKLDDFGRMTDRQRAFAKAVLAGEKYEPPIEYSNDWSAGRVPMGKPVELLVRDRPLKPPGRRCE